MTDNDKWLLQKYAKFCGEESREGMVADKEWKLYETGTEDKTTLTLTVAERHLLITQGETILESHSLWKACESMTGVSKGDSLLVVQKSQSESRRFRVKFAPGSTTGEERCASCVAKLIKFFPFKQIGTDQGAATEKHDRKLGAEESLGTIAKVLKGDLKSELPSAYRKVDISDDALDTAIRLCLSDSQFPAFVQTVSQRLNQIIKESS